MCVCVYERERERERERESTHHTCMHDCVGVYACFHGVSWSEHDPVAIVCMHCTIVVL